MITAAEANILWNPRDSRQNQEQGAHDSLSPAEGERVEVRGKSLPSQCIYTQPVTLSLSPSEGERESASCAFRTPCGPLSKDD